MAFWDKNHYNSYPDERLINNNWFGSSTQTLCVGCWPSSYHNIPSGKLKIFRLKFNGSSVISDTCTNTQFGHLPIIQDLNASTNYYCMLTAIQVTENFSDGTSQSYLKLTVCCINVSGGGDFETKISIVSYPNNYISGNPGGSNSPTLDSVSNIHIVFLYDWFLNQTNAVAGGFRNSVYSIDIDGTLNINDYIIYSLNGLHINGGSGYYKIDGTRYKISNGFYNDTGQLVTGIYAYVSIYSGALGIPHY